MKLTVPIGLKIMRNIPFPNKLGILERLYGEALSRKGICWVQTSNGGSWKLDLRDVTLVATPRYGV